MEWVKPAILEGRRGLNLRACGVKCSEGRVKPVSLL
jgi:hypothetical protein